METAEPIEVSIDDKQNALVWRFDRKPNGEECIGITLPNNEEWGLFAECTADGEVIRLPKQLAKDLAKAILA